MGRNSGGSYTNPIPPFVPGTTIKTQEMNPKFQDIYDALTDSLSRTGQGSMEVPLQLKDGSAASPSLTFASDVGTGLYRPSPYTVRMVSQAATLQEWALTYVNINRPLVVNPPAGAAATGVIVAGVLTGSGGVFTGGTPDDAQVGGSGIDSEGGSGGPGAAGGVGILATGGAGTSQGVGLRASGGIVGASAPIDPSGTVRPTRYRFEYPSIPFLANGTYPLNGLVLAQAGNQVALDVYSRNVGTPVGWEQVRLGLRYDVDGSPGAGGMLELGSSGASISRGGAANATTPVAGLTMTNAHIAFASTVVQPARATGVRNVLTPPSFPKAWVRISVVSGASPVINIEDGLNVSNVLFASPNGTDGRITIEFAEDFANSTYSWGYTVTKGDKNRYFVWETTAAAGTLTVTVERIQTTAPGFGFQIVDFTNVNQPVANSLENNNLTSTITFIGRQ